jgi:hypothetical protein
MFAKIKKEQDLSDEDKNKEETAFSFRPIVMQSSGLPAGMLPAMGSICNTAGTDSQY